MKNQTEVIEKLLTYGIDSKRQSERSLQQKIIQMYELLEIKTTQNLLLRKQNDDVKLQINTINQLFASVLNSPSNISSNNQQALIQSCKTDESFERKQEINKPVQKFSTELQPNFQHRNSQNGHKKEAFSKKYFESSQTSQQSSVQTQSKTPRYPPKPQKNIRNNLNIYDKGQTARQIPQQSNEQTDHSLNEKIELLMRQNEIILKRMNQMEVNFINTAQNQGLKQYNKNTLDDRSTNISAKVPSINKISTKRQNSELISYNKGHYSTSNFRSYCPSVQ